LNNLPISIVTVCRNAEATIAGTIESVRDQQYPDLEYIIIDGASTDITPDIVRSFGSMINVFVSEPDSGIADAFNKGISRALGEIIGLINADDELLPGTLNKVGDFFSRHPDIDVVHGDVLLSRGQQVLKRVRPAGCWWYPWRLVLFNHPATFVRRSVYEQYGLFDASYRIAMDVEIFLRWMRKGINIAYLPDPLVAMQVGGLSGRLAFQGYREVKRALSANSFPALPANIQYIARFGVQLVVTVQDKLRKLKSDK
jgi:glycosyltransferase involved in cell wall biosynthesis